MKLRRTALLAAAFAALALPATARGADSVYWSAFGAIRVGNLDGSGSAATLFREEATFAVGVAIDPAANRIYWATGGSGAIRVGNLDGSGSPSDLFMGEDDPSGVAIDPAANRIYWATDDAIRVGNLDGSGSPSDLFSGEDLPQGVAIDPAANRIYWANGGFPGAIRVGNLDGSGSAATLFTGGDAIPSGVAIDPAANRIYWTSGEDAGGIRVANLDGSGSPSNLFVGEFLPTGVAIDPAANRIYWADDDAPGPVRTGLLDGSGSASDLFTGELSPTFPALLHSPASTGAPQISGGGQVGALLSCSRGSWASDLPGAFLFRAPRAFAYQWQLNGAEIPAATEPSITTTEPGTYTCRVTASNQAGDRSQTSAAHEVTSANAHDVTPSNELRLGKLKRNKRRGTAKLTVEVPGPGELALAKRKNVKPAKLQPAAAGKLRLRIRPRGQAQRKLSRAGKLERKKTTRRLTARLTYTPAGGTPNTESKKLKLIRRPATR
ncbi:MAG: hypothetical protein GEU88_13910 [Solirubrobacterales bacterium]|nr:hypothetical protein [Solirubrobacterales bacterium]